MSDIDRLANQLTPFILRKIRQASGTVVSANSGTLTDAQIFQAVLSQDGAGSELDADTVDGYQAADFALAGHDHDDLATLYAAAWHGHSHAPTTAQVVAANHTLTLDHLDLSNDSSVDLEAGAALHLIG